MRAWVPRRPSFGPLEQWQRNQYAVVASVALAFCAFELSNPFIPLYIRQQLGVTDVNDAAFWAGLVSGITPMLAALMGPVWGVVADRYGRKSMVVRALICIGIAQFCTAFVPNVYWLLGLRTIMGMFAGFTSMSMALAISVSPRERMPQTISLVQAAQIAPSAIGPLIGGPLADLVGQRTSFMVTGLLLLLPIALVSLVLKESPRAPATGKTSVKQQSAGRSMLSLMMLPGFGVAVAILFLTRFGERAIQPIVPLYLIELQTPSAQLATITGVAVAGGAIAATCSSLLYGRWAHPGTIRRVLVGALSGAAVAALLFAFAGGWPEVIGLRLLVGLLAGGTISLAYTMGARLAPPDRSATTMSLLASCGMLGTATAPILAGLIAQNIGLRAVFGMTAVAYVVAASLLAIPALREARSHRRASLTSAAEAEST